MEFSNYISTEFLPFLFFFFSLVRCSTAYIYKLRGTPGLGRIRPGPIREMGTRGLSSGGPIQKGIQYTKFRPAKAQLVDLRHKPSLDKTTLWL